LVFLFSFKEHCRSDLEKVVVSIFVYVFFNSTQLIDLNFAIEIKLFAISTFFRFSFNFFFFFYQKLKNKKNKTKQNTTTTTTTKKGRVRHIN